MREYTPPAPGENPDEDDPWGFVTARNPRPANEGSDSALDALIDESAPAPERSRIDAAGDETAMDALRRRGRPMAWALAAVFFFGFITEVVAAARFISQLGAIALVIIYIVGGLALIAAALLQMTWIDRIPRGKALVTVTIGYSIIFIIAIVLIANESTTVWGTGLSWLVADQLNFLLPFIIWSIVGDLFNAGEGRKIYPWITSWQYAGQLIGLAVAAVAPLILIPLGLPLWTLLVVCPIGILLVGILLPRGLAGRAISRGHGRDESLGESLKQTWQFVGGVNAFRALFYASVLVFVAAQTLEASYLTSANTVFNGDDAKLQVLYGATAVIVFTICALLQKFYTTKIVERFVIPGTLALLPVAAVIAAVLIALGIVTGPTLPLIVVGIICWWIARWSVGEVARHAALAVVPDEKRARVSFVLGVVPFAAGLIVAGLITWIVSAIGYPVVAPVIALAFAALAIPPSRRMVAAWSDALLDPRLRRRKRLNG